MWKKKHISSVVYLRFGVRGEMTKVIEFGCSTKRQYTFWQKGYRYINAPSNHVPYTKFEELVAVYDFAAQLKSLFYPNVMLIETAVKNYVLDILVASTNSDNFIDIYNQLLDNYKMFSTKGNTYKNVYDRQKAEEKFKLELKRRLDLHNRIYKVQTDAYGNGNKIAEQMFQKNLGYGLLMIQTPCIFYPFCIL